MASLASVRADQVGRAYHTLRRADGVVVCERCLVADRPLSRMKGLLGRSELPPGEGIFIRPCRSIHTFFMRFPIDAVFVDRAGVVKKIVTNLKPWRTAGARCAHAVVELAAGEAERRDLAPGDHLESLPGRAAPNRRE